MCPCIHRFSEQNGFNDKHERRIHVVLFANLSCSFFLNWLADSVVETLG